MVQDKKYGYSDLTGRIQAAPDNLLDEEILLPQFHADVQHLLPYYLFIEKAMTTEYFRLNLLTQEAATEVLQLLSSINQENLQADAETNMSDICFAIERFVLQRLTRPAPFWHVDRSRNDVQATAQVMAARKEVLSTLTELFRFAEEVHKVATVTLSMPMPGYTHYQSAQIITPGFYLSAVNEQIGKTIARLLALYTDMNECPLGSGAMAGLELAWDRDRLANMLGFRRPVRNALSGVASKEWALQIAAELSNCSVQLSRFVTDLITWGSGEYGLIDLPDQLSGISSAMPQKKNFPVLERIRGRLAHLPSFYLDLVLGQRSTPYTNLVETAKEGGRHFTVLTSSMRSALKLFSTVVAHLTFREERMRELCTRDFFGGSTLANFLTLTHHIPCRTAQAIVGRYIVSMMKQNRLPEEVDVTTLEALCQEYHYPIQVTAHELQQAFDIRYNLEKKATRGSTHPAAVAELLINQKEERDQFYQRFQHEERLEQMIGHQIAI